jgi:hypothetical protein
MTEVADRLSPAIEILRLVPPSPHADGSRLLHIDHHVVAEAAVAWARAKHRRASEAARRCLATWYGCGALAQITAAYRGRYHAAWLGRRVRAGHRHHYHVRLLHYLAAEAAGIHRSWLILRWSRFGEDDYCLTLNTAAREYGLPIQIRLRPPILADYGDTSPRVETCSIAME